MLDGNDKIYLWKQYYWAAIGRGKDPDTAATIATRRLARKGAHGGGCTAAASCQHGGQRNRD